MEININLKVLKEHKLSISEYVYLHSLYLGKSQEEIGEIVSCLDRVEEDTLQQKMYVKIMPNGEVILRNKGKNLFEKGDLFNRFLVMFPVKAPSGRALSPATEDTVKGRSLRKKWAKAFKKNPEREQRALDVLEAELDWRRRSNKMEFIHNAEAWLNQGDYENYEYLLEEKEKQDENQYKHFM